MSLLPGSEREPLAGAAPVGPIGDDEKAEVLIVVRRQPGQTATQQDMDAIGNSLPKELKVSREHLQSGRVHVTGRVNDLARFFGTELSLVWQQDDARHYRHRTGPLRVPDELDGIVVAVLGLDDRRAARTNLVIARETPAASYTPLEVAAAYRFPDGTDGTGQRIGIVELGGGYAQSDLTAYFSELGVPSPTVTDHLVDGATNDAGSDPEGADAEVLLDIEITGAVAPKAAIDVWFAPNTDAGFVDAVSEALHNDEAPTALSISWGGPEDSWTAQARAALDAALADADPKGITVCVAAGDSGSTDGDARGTHVDFPASSPHALACGGTTLQLTADETIASEVVWNSGADSSGASHATGGGVSTAFPRPQWQDAAGVPGDGRGVPDVAGDADPQTGYVVRVDGESTVIGGTSAVAPLWAGLITRLAQATGKRFGLIQPLLYADPEAFRDITSGSNGGYDAQPGWDPCTGLGSPDGAALLAGLS